jgi:hypothetical protein
LAKELSMSGEGRKLTVDDSKTVDVLEVGPTGSDTKLIKTRKRQEKSKFKFQT